MRFVQNGTSSSPGAMACSAACAAGLAVAAGAGAALGARAARALYSALSMMTLATHSGRPAGWVKFSPASSKEKNRSAFSGLGFGVPLGRAMIAAALAKVFAPSRLQGLFIWWWFW